MLSRAILRARCARYFIGESCGIINDCYTYSIDTLISGVFGEVAMPFKKTILSMCMVVLFSIYALFERNTHDHGDFIAYVRSQATAGTMSSMDVIVGYLAPRAQVPVVATDTESTAIVSPADMAALQAQQQAFQEFVAYINQQAKNNPHPYIESPLYPQTHATSQPALPVSPLVQTKPSITAPKRLQTHTSSFADQYQQALAQMQAMQGQIVAPDQSQYLAQQPAISGAQSAVGQQTQDQLAAQQQTQTQVPALVQQQTPAPVQTTPQQTQSSGQYRDGVYTGPSINVYYGDVQVQAIIQGGKLFNVTFLSYPNERSTSQAINNRAMPVLVQEAISAQSASVDAVSGASATSDGFTQSLSAALSQAKA